MAYTKILVVHNRLDKSIDYATNEEITTLEHALDYALNRDKTEKTCFESAVNCEVGTAYSDMMKTKKRWGKGKTVVKGYHIIQSFAPGEITPEIAHEIGVKFAQRLLGEEYEVIVGTHLNKEHLHSHIVFNSVSFMTGRMYRNKFRDYFGREGIRGVSDALCLEYGMSIIDPSYEGRQYGEWKAEQDKKPSLRSSVKQDIDDAISRAYTFKSFVKAMEEKGYRWKGGPNVTHAALILPGGQHVRLRSLKEGYTEDDIKERIAAGRFVRPADGKPESLPSLPPSPQLRMQEPQMRYYVKKTAANKLPRKLRGYRALYFKYLYLFGVMKKGRFHSEAACFMRGDLARFEQYKRQFDYLMKNRLETAQQLSFQHNAIQAEIDALVDERSERYQQKRSGGDSAELTANITEITDRLKVLRRNLKLCQNIDSDAKRIHSFVENATQGRNHPHEKSNLYRPRRNSADHPLLHANQNREH